MFADLLCCKLIMFQSAIIYDTLHRLVTLKKLIFSEFSILVDTGRNSYFKALSRGPGAQGGGELREFPPPCRKIELTFFILDESCWNFQGIQIDSKDVDFRALFVKLEIWEVWGPIFGPHRFQNWKNAIWYWNQLSGCSQIDDYGGTRALLCSVWLVSIIAMSFKG